ncbi:hypothetical protein HY640_03310 [Candidatus Woesearchaeota archaeon]|nr:hypothetical protein [Candidatus Woesearchaeota archaeon]
MVKKLIDQLLKKEAPAQSDKAADVPNELPPLSEESAAQPQKDAVPEQLPSLEPEKPDSAQPAPVQSEPKPVFSNFETKQMPAMGESPVQPDLSLNESSFGRPADAPSSVIKQGAGKEESFFHDLLHVIRSPKSIDKLVSEDLLARMKENWAFRKRDDALSSRDRLEMEVLAKLNELKYLEGKWRSQKLILEEEEKVLRERERDMNGKIADFKKFLLKVKLYQQVPAKDFLVLDNCMIIKSLKDMVDASKALDERTFRRHVNRERNDIGEWAMRLDSRLASRLKDVRSARELQAVMDQYEKRMVSGN